MGFEYKKYLRAIKPVPTPRSMAPYLPEIISNWADDELRRAMDKEYYEDLEGWLHTKIEDAIGANKNIRQEHGTENKSLDYNI